MSRFFLLLITLGALGVPTLSAQASGPYAPEILANLVKPSITRIVTHISGEATVVPIKIDVRRGLIAIDPATEPTRVQVDEYISGSGFVIHPDGYIATNAHVVSAETIQHALASESVMAAFYANALFLSEEEAQAFFQSEEAEAFGKRAIRTVIEQSQFALKTETFVLNPQSKKERLTDLIKEAFPAEIKSLSENFLENDRDVALIQIAQNRLPAIPLSSESALSVGSTAYVFGFPGTAELNRKNPLEATFTRGVVSAVRTAAEQDFSLYQTDAKVSQGSSGGPLFNDQGEVVGLVTFQTAELDRSAGDNFAFALPEALIRDEAAKIGLTLDRHEILADFSRGIDAYGEKHCQEALMYFQKAEGVNETFSLAKAMAPYQERCRSLQVNGQAIDTRWDALRAKTERLDIPIVMMLGIITLLFAVFGAILFWLMRQVRREESEIVALRRRIQNDAHREHERRYGKERIGVHGRENK